MISELIAEYIASGNKRLVIPGFGAFIRKDSGEVVLVEFLKKDDGVLISLLTARLNISEQDALGAIDTYIAEIKRSIAALGNYPIKGLGCIFVTPNGLYELEYAPQQQAAPSAPSINSTTTATTQQTVSKPQAVRTTASPGTLAQQASRQTPPAPAPTTRPQATASVPRPVQMSKPMQTPASDSIARPYSRPLQQPTPAQQQRPVYTKPAYRPAQRPKKKTDVVMILAVLAAIIAVAAIGFGVLVNGNPAKQMVPVAPPPIESTVNINGNQ